MDTESIHHDSRRFFSVICVHDGECEKIIIDQPEIGILGFIVAGTTEQRKWLLQRKSEPGNLQYEQWAPTVQATISNYQRVHGGEATPFLDEFVAPRNPVCNVLGSEQGSRFFNKFNRNCKILVEEPFSLDCFSHRFDWVGSESLKEMLRLDYTVNTDARSAIVSGAWHLLADSDELFLHGPLQQEVALAIHRSYGKAEPWGRRIPEELISQISHEYPLSPRRVAINQMKEHLVGEDGIYTAAGERVVGYFDIHMPSREVSRWQQPLLEQSGTAHCALLLYIHNKIAYFSVSLYPEAGHIGRIELGPTIQTGLGIFKHSDEDVAATLANSEILADIHQSDEGGRFFQNVCRYTLGRWHGDPSALDAVNRCWVTASELERLSLFNGKITNELRTLLSLLLSFA